MRLPRLGALSIDTGLRSFELLGFSSVVLLTLKDVIFECLQNSSKLFGMEPLFLSLMVLLVKWFLWWTSTSFLLTLTMCSFEYVVKILTQDYLKWHQCVYENKSDLENLLGFLKSWICVCWKFDSMNFLLLLKFNFKRTYISSYSNYLCDHVIAALDGQ